MQKYAQQHAQVLSMAHPRHPHPGPLIPLPWPTHRVICIVVPAIPIAFTRPPPLVAFELAGGGAATPCITKDVETLKQRVE